MTTRNTLIKAIAPVTVSIGLLGIIGCSSAPEIEMVPKSDYDATSASLTSITADRDKLRREIDGDPDNPDQPGYKALIEERDATITGLNGQINGVDEDGDGTIDIPGYETRISDLNNSIRNVDTGYLKQIADRDAQILDLQANPPIIREFNGVKYELESQKTEEYMDEALDLWKSMRPAGSPALVEADLYALHFDADKNRSDERHGRRLISESEAQTYAQKLRGHFEANLKSPTRDAQRYQFGNP